MDLPIYNTTENLVFPCPDDEIGERSIAALSLAMKCIKTNLDITYLTQDEIDNEPARAALPRLTLFKFFGEAKAENIDRKWVEKAFVLASSSYQKVRSEISELIPEEAKHKKITQNHARALKRELVLFIHCCWATKLALIPMKFSSLPTLKNSEGEQFEWAFEAYPEILKFIRSPFCDELAEFSIVEKIGKKAIRNLNWYAHRYVRACAAWEVEDITPELLSLINESPNKKVPRTIDWYIALIDLVPERVAYTIGDVYEKKSGGTFGKNTYRKSPELSIDNFPPLVIESNPNIKDWVNKSDEYVRQLYDNGIKSFNNYSLAIGKVLKGLIADQNPVPLVRDINRTLHIDIIKKVLKENAGKEHYRSQLYKLSEFFDYITLIEKSFSNPISSKLDFPRVGRPKGTKKEIVEEDVFGAFLSYLYAIADWIFYFSERYDNKVEFLTKNNNSLNSINPSDLGFQPLIYIDGEYHAIKTIPYQFFSPLFGHKSKDSQLTEVAIMPHYINLATVMAECGIRLIHLRWLDKELYAQEVERRFFQERSYVPSKLHINTDKSHGAWVADVSESVIGLLDRQLYWRNKYLQGRDKPIPYDYFENSEFKDITPLFATANSQSTIYEDFSAVEDNTFRKHFKNFLVGFSWTYKELGYEPPVNIEDCTTIEQCLKKWRTKSINYTPHSMRSQVVSDNITMLPPSVIQRITGHSNEAHVLYYAQLNEDWIDKQQDAQDKEFKDFIGPMFIDAKSKNSKLNHAMKTDPLGALKDFGGISFGTATQSGLNKIKDDLKAEVDVHDTMAFNSTHMCPFTNQCPADLENKVLKGFKSCGGCPYAIKTIDHLPAIVAKIRAYADKSSELEETINRAKQSNADIATYRGEVALRKYYVDEISAWTVTVTCLESMASSLDHKDKWLVSKPEYLSKKLSSIKSSNELTNTLIRIEEAQNSDEFMTPQLKARVLIFRNKILAQSGQFQKLLEDAPTEKNLISEFKGIIKGICDITGISVAELPKALAQQKAILPNTLKQPIQLPNSLNGGSNG